MQGVLIAANQDIIKSGYSLDGARIQDIAPTVLYLMGHEIPTDMDGKVLMDIFLPDFVKSNPLKTRTRDKHLQDEEDKEAYSDEEEATLREWLRSLGYVN
jgi:hypothetical protein